MEVTFKSIKTEFIKGEKLMTSGKLQLAFAIYVYWHNHKRVHSLLDYLPPVEFNKRLSFNFMV
ncbi:IS3 family transposase [Snodgrassella gandavensis]|uniref:IS3 family transposase n=1 Tax=Snodgrassella gandavensis TaxID=2946698 RepID=UPI003B847DEA